LQGKGTRYIRNQVSGNLTVDQCNQNKSKRLKKNQKEVGVDCKNELAKLENELVSRAGSFKREMLNLPTRKLNTKAKVIFSKVI